MVRCCWCQDPAAVRCSVLAAIIGIRAWMAFAFQTASRALAGLHTDGKAIQWRDEGDNCEQRYGDVNDTSHSKFKHSKPRKGRTPQMGTTRCFDPRVR